MILKLPKPMLEQGRESGVGSHDRELVKLSSAMESLDGSFNLGGFKV